MYVCLFYYLSVYLAICLFVYLSVCLCVCHWQCRSVHSYNSSWQCQFVNSTADCRVQEGYIQYIIFIYCTMGTTLIPLAVTILVGLKPRPLSHSTPLTVCT